MGSFLGRVEIEAEWNLKPYKITEYIRFISVEIEAEWNLKIPEIRAGDIIYCRDRSRVEFKVGKNRLIMRLMLVEIEAEWNLKQGCS